MDITPGINLLQLTLRSKSRSLKDDLTSKYRAIAARVPRIAGEKTTASGDRNPTPPTAARYRRKHGGACKRRLPWLSLFSGNQLLIVDQPTGHGPSLNPSPECAPSSG